MDALLTLAFAMHKSPGVYAVLLGSGVSRSAGVPTGWEITQDLIQQVNEVASGQVTEDTGYDVLLRSLAKTQAERQGLLRSYFEPTTEERESGLKLPTIAHRSIAQLTVSGHIRVIITTNFDRLMENALEEQGIVPIVLSTDDAIQGRQPIRHAKVVVVKIHGDYLDERILNTPEELTNYSAARSELLAEIFDNYGLIVCGWSASWDVGLRSALERTANRRYTTYWIEPYDLSDPGKQLASRREAEIIQSAADDAFRVLQSNVEALGKINRQHPLSVQVAVERAKKLLANPSGRIELEDLLRAESEAAYERFDPNPPSGENMWQIYTAGLERSYRAAETVLHLVTTIVWYGADEFAPLISSIIRRWGSPRNKETEYNPWLKMPTLLLSYTCALASTRHEKWEYLKASIPRLIERPGDRETSFLKLVNRQIVFAHHEYISQRDPIGKLLMEE